MARKVTRSMLVFKRDNTSIQKVKGRWKDHVKYLNGYTMAAILFFMTNEVTRW